MGNDDEATQEAVEAVYTYAAQLAATGSSDGEIEDALIAKGLDKKSARVVTERVMELKREARQKAASKNMLYGGLWCGGGLLVTVMTYSAASDGGGRYVVAWGAIIFGAIQFFRGLSQRDG